MKYKIVKTTYPEKDSRGYPHTIYSPQKLAFFGLMWFRMDADSWGSCDSETEAMDFIIRDRSYNNSVKTEERYD